MGKYIITVIIGYLIGNFTSSYFVGRLYKGIDIREHGSGNAGATNTIRVLGIKAGMLVFALDLIKGILAAVIGWLIIGDRFGAIFTGMFAVIGHNWPVVLNFKGGKGIATSFGILIVVFPKIVTILFIVGIILIAITKYVSLGSISAAVLFPILLVAFKEPIDLMIVGFLMSIMALYRHKDNFKRLIAGTENKISINRKNK